MLGVVMVIPVAGQALQAGEAEDVVVAAGDDARVSGVFLQAHGTGLSVTLRAHLAGCVLQSAVLR